MGTDNTVGTASAQDLMSLAKARISWRFQYNRVSFESKHLLEVFLGPVESYGTMGPRSECSVRCVTNVHHSVRANMLEDKSLKYIPEFKTLLL